MYALLFFDSASWSSYEWVEGSHLSDASGGNQFYACSTGSEQSWSTELKQTYYVYVCFWAPKRDFFALCVNLRLRSRMVKMDCVLRVRRFKRWSIRMSSVSSALSTWTYRIAAKLANCSFVYIRPYVCVDQSWMMPHQPTAHALVSRST